MSGRPLGLTPAWENTPMQTRSWAEPPWAETPLLGQTPPSFYRRPLQQTVHIILESIHVLEIYLDVVLNKKSVGVITGRKGRLCFLQTSVCSQRG